MFNYLTEFAKCILFKPIQRITECIPTHVGLQFQVFPSTLHDHGANINLGNVHTLAPKVQSVRFGLVLQQDVR